MSIDIIRLVLLNSISVEGKNCAVVFFFVCLSAGLTRKLSKLLISHNFIHCATCIHC